MSRMQDGQEVEVANVRDACGLDARENNTGTTFRGCLIVLHVDGVLSACYDLWKSINMGESGGGEREATRRGASEHRRPFQTQPHFSLFPPSGPAGSP